MPFPLAVCALRSGEGRAFLLGWIFTPDSAVPSSYHNFSYAKGTVIEVEGVGLEQGSLLESLRERLLDEGKIFRQKV